MLHEQTVPWCPVKCKCPGLKKQKTSSLAVPSLFIGLCISLNMGATAPHPRQMLIGVIFAFLFGHFSETEMLSILIATVDMCKPLRKKMHCRKQFSGTASEYSAIAR